MKSLPHIGSLLICALAVQGCSSKPRHFNPMLGAAPIDGAAYEAAYHACQVQIGQARASGMDRLASGGAGVAAGAAAGAAGTAAAGTTTTFVGGMAAAGATLIAMPVVAVVGAWGLAKSKKLKKEKAIQAATAECLGDAGYQVVGWQRANRETDEK